MYFGSADKEISMPKNLAIKLTATAEKLVKQGHPWVFSKSIVKQNHQGEAGDLTILFDQKDNQVFALGLYDPESPIRIKVIHAGGPAKINTDFFDRKLQKAYRIRQPLLQTDTNAYRFLFGENDGFPGLIVDVYNKVGVVKVYSPIWFPYLSQLMAPLVKIAGLDGVVLRLSRKLQQSSKDYTEGMLLHGTLENPEVLFKEYGVKFQTNVLLGHKTGFFLDHRENRRKIGRMANGKTVLDVFAYAGGFSVHALAGGAKEVTSLDVSAQALELAQKNARLNHPKGKHLIMVGDAFKLLQEVAEQGKTYDLVIIDPPSFAKSKNEIELAKKKYAELASIGAQLTVPGGLLLLASCSSRVSKEEFLKVHEDVFRREGITYRMEDFTEHDSDHPIGFPEGAYLKSAYYRIC